MLAIIYNHKRTPPQIFEHRRGPFWVSSHLRVGRTLPWETRISLFRITQNAGALGRRRHLVLLLYQALVATLKLVILFGAQRQYVSGADMIEYIATKFTLSPGNPWGERAVSSA